MNSLPDERDIKKYKLSGSEPGKMKKQGKTLPTCVFFQNEPKLPLLFFSCCLLNSTGIDKRKLKIIHANKRDRGSQTLYRAPAKELKNEHKGRSVEMCFYIGGVRMMRTK